MFRRIAESSVDFGVRQVCFFFNLAHHFGTSRSVPKNVRTADGAKYLANFCSKKLLFLKHFFDADLSGSEVFKKRFEAEAKTCQKSSVPPRSRCFFLIFIMDVQISCVFLFLQVPCEGAFGAKSTKRNYRMIN